MELTKDTYTVSRATISLVMEVLSANWFSSDGEEEYNNDDVIDADEALQAEIQVQENATPDIGGEVDLLRKAMKEAVVTLEADGDEHGVAEKLRQALKTANYGGKRVDD